MIVDGLITGIVSGDRHVGAAQSSPAVGVLLPTFRGPTGKLGLRLNPEAVPRKASLDTFILDAFDGRCGCFVWPPKWEPTLPHACTP